MHKRIDYQLHFCAFIISDLFPANTWPKYIFFLSFNWEIYNGTCIYTKIQIQTGDESDTKYADTNFVFTPFDIKLD